MHNDLLCTERAQGALSAGPRAAQGFLGSWMGGWWGGGVVGWWGWWGWWGGGLVGWWRGGVVGWWGGGVVGSGHLLANLVFLDFPISIFVIFEIISYCEICLEILVVS